MDKKASASAVPLSYATACALEPLGHRATQEIPLSEEQKGAVLGRLLNLHTKPAMIVDVDGVVIALNSLGAGLVGERQGIHVGRDGILKLETAAASLELAEKIRATAASSDPAHLALVNAPRVAGNDACFLLVRKLPPAVNGDGGGEASADHALTLVTVQGELARFGLEIDVLIDAFGLTRAEAEIALALAAGETLQTYVTRAGIKVTTARWHLRHALRKTHTSSQRELIRLVTSLPIL